MTTILDNLTYFAHFLFKGTARPDRYGQVAGSPCVMVGISCANDFVGKSSHFPCKENLQAYKNYHFSCNENRWRWKNNHFPCNENLQAYKNNYFPCKEN